MPTKNRLTLLSPEGIGLASVFRKTPQRFVRIRNGSLQDGDLLLQLTLKELGAIRRASKEMHTPRPELFKDAKSQYKDLLKELERLENVQQSTSVFNLVKRLEIRRETNDLLEAGYELYVTVKSTSESMQRTLLSCTSQVEEVEGQDIHPGEQLKGIAVTDAEGPLNDEQASIVTDPVDDRHALDQIISGGNLQVVQNVQVYNTFIGCVNADNSDAGTITVNNNTNDSAPIQPSYPGRPAPQPST